MEKAGEWLRAPLAAVFPSQERPAEPSVSPHIPSPQTKAAHAVCTPAVAGEAAPSASQAERLLRSVQGAPGEAGVSSATDDAETPAEPLHAPQYLVFSSAGKLVYASGDASDAVFAHAGVMQALLALFAGEGGDTLRSIDIEDEQKRRTRVSVLSQPPLHVTCTSSRDEPRAQAHAQLARVHAAVVSLVSETRLRQLFQQKPSFDLRGLLLPMQAYLDGVVADMDASLALPLRAVPVHPLDAALRAAIARTITPTPDESDAERPRDVLYALVVRQGLLVCLAHPKRHAPHTEDLALLLTMVRCGGACPGEEDAWAPMCLPHSAPHGFVFVYASRLHPGADGATLVLVTGDRDGFARGRAWRARLQPACVDGCLRALHTSAAQASADALGITGLRHYVLASRRHAQCTSVAPPYATAARNGRLFALYAHALAALAGGPRPHDVGASLDAAGDARVPLSLPCRLQHYRTAQEAVLGWSTASFTLLVAVRPPWLSKAAIAAAANRVAAHVRRNDKHLFAAAYTF